jgi:hypothetical protein
MMLLPEHRDDGTADWKIWVFCTWLIGFDEFPPDEGKLGAPSKVPGLLSQDKLETDVVIIGAGNRYADSFRNLRSI